MVGWCGWASPMESRSYVHRCVWAINCNWVKANYRCLIGRETSQSYIRPLIITFLPSGRWLSIPLRRLPLFFKIFPLTGGFTAHPICLEQFFAFAGVSSVSVLVIQNDRLRSVRFMCSYNWWAPTQWIVNRSPSRLPEVGQPPARPPDKARWNKMKYKF